MARRFAELAASVGLLSVLEPVVRGPEGFDRESSIVEAACRGGASGMLAGRAVWTVTLGADDPAELLRAHSVPRLRELGAIVDAHGRPWREKTGT